MSFKDSEKVKELLPNAENVAYVMKIVSTAHAVVRVLEQQGITESELEDVLNAIPDVSTYRIHSI